MDELRQALEEFRGKRITVTGVFDKFGWRTDSSGKKVTTALLQALEKDGQPVATHCHVQFADNFVPLDMARGDRVSFQAIVMQYKRRLAVTNEACLLVEIDYGLYHPTAIKLLDRDPPAYMAQHKAGEIEEIEEEVEMEDEPQTNNAANPTGQITDPLALIAVVKKTAINVGGWDRLQGLIDALRQ